MEVINLLSRFLVANPAHRLGILFQGPNEVKAHPWFASIDWDVIAKREGYAPIVPSLMSREDTSNFKPDPSAHSNNFSMVQIPQDVQAFFDSF